MLAFRLVSPLEVSKLTDKVLMANNIVVFSEMSTSLSYHLIFNTYSVMKEQNILLLLRQCPMTMQRVNQERLQICCSYHLCNVPFFLKFHEANIDVLINFGS